MIQQDSQAAASIENKLINQLTNNSPADADKEFELPDPLSAGIVNTTTKDAIRILKDGSIDIHAGKCRILLDSNSGQITILGSSLVFQGDSSTFHVKNNKFNIGYRSLNPEWLGNKYSDLDPSEEIDKVGELSRSPLVFNLLGIGSVASSDAGEKILNKLFLELRLAPDSLEPPIYMSLAQLFKPVPLFKSSSKLKTMVKRLKDILVSLVT